VADSGRENIGRITLLVGLGLMWGMVAACATGGGRPPGLTQTATATPLLRPTATRTASSTSSLAVGNTPTVILLEPTEKLVRATAATIPTPTRTRTPTPTLAPTFTPPSPLPPTPTPTTTPTPAPVPTETRTPVPAVVPSEATTATPTDAESTIYRYQPIGPAQPELSQPCPGCPRAPGYIIGRVVDAGGHPLAGVRLVCYNDWHRYPVVSTKGGGEYDFPIIQAEATWYVVVLDEADRPLSPEVPVHFTPLQACWYRLDWQRIN